jgi:V/A-type H+-transporting ATPase subunit F
MSTYRIAIVGQKEAVAGFALLGIDVMTVQDAVEAVKELFRLKKMTSVVDGKERNAYGVVFVSEDLLQGASPDDHRRLARGALPAIVPLPSHRGSTGYSMQRLKSFIERAIGSDILQ